MSNTIFVQIASYRDHQLPITITDMIDNAVHPENLRIVVCWQRAADETVDFFLDRGYTHAKTEEVLGDELIFLTYKNAQIELIDLHYLKTHGACWARNKIQQHYKKEKYTLQLDSHHRFIQNWDEELINMLESVRDVSPKPLLTAYIPSFDPENDPAARVQEPWKMDFDRFIPEGAVFFRPSTIDDWRERSRPMLSRFYSAHFAFADGIFAEEVQHDPEYFFHGEEISIGVRAFTHGYDLYHPHRVIAWHEYTRKGRIKVWDDHTTQQKNKGKVSEDWWERNVKCHKRNRILFGMDGEDPTSIDFGKYGFGTVRSVKDFEEYAGMSFKYRGIQQKVLDRVEPSLTWETYDTEEDWKNTLARSNDVRVCINKSDIQWNPLRLYKKESDGWHELQYTTDTNYVMDGMYLVDEGQQKVLQTSEDGWKEVESLNTTQFEDSAFEYWLKPRSANPEPYTEKDFDFFYVGTHDENHNEIYRKDLSESEILNYLNSGDWIDYRFIFMCDPSKIAKTYSVWPHSKSKGWLNRIDRFADS